MTRKAIFAILSILLPLAVAAGDGDIPDWENQYVTQIGAEPARAYFLPFGEQPGDRTLTLNGTWKFRWTKTPAERVSEFYHIDYDCSGWGEIAVPANSHLCIRRFPIQDRPTACDQ